MELLYNRRLLLLNQDLPFSISTSPHILNTPSSPSSPPPSSSSSSSSSSSMSGSGSPLQVPPRPIFSSNVAYAFLILFTALFFLGFIILYFRRDSSRDHPHPSSCKDVDPTVAAKSLPAFSYRGDEKQKQQVDCAICLEELREGEKVKKIMYCNHVFHQECIDTWLAAHVTCPICRCNKLCEMRVGDEHEHGHGGESRVEEEEEEERERWGHSHSHSPSEGRRSSY